jgi:hypothetical protein
MLRSVNPIPVLFLNARQIAQSQNLASRLIIVSPEPVWQEATTSILEFLCFATISILLSKG